MAPDNMRRSVAVTFDYARHFLGLGAVAAVLVLVDRWQPVRGAIPSCGLYGALHSCALMVALRMPQTAWKKAAFGILASCLAMLSLVTARGVGDWLNAVPGLDSPLPLLTLASGLGAASYGLLIRHFWIPDLPLRALAWIALCCAISTLLALPLGAYLHTVGAAWFAIIWWWAFSLALCYRDGRRHRIEATHAWHS